MAGLDEEKHEPDKKQLPQGHPHAVPVREGKNYLPSEAKPETEFTTSNDLGCEDILQLATAPGMAFLRDGMGVPAG